MKAIKHILIFGLGLCLPASCIKDTASDCLIPDDPNGGKKMVLTLSNTTPGTRGVTDLLAEESAVDRVAVFFYAEDESECVYTPDRLTLDGTTVTMTIDETLYNSDLLGNTFIVYLVANLPDGATLDTSGTLDDLKQTVVENSAGMTFNGAGVSAGTLRVPEEFLMTGQTDVTVSGAQSQSMGEISLERTAAKIVVNISSADVEGYTATAARVRLANYLNTTALDGEYQYEATQGDEYGTAVMTLTTGEDTSFWMDPAYSSEVPEEGVANALYSYPNDWNDDIEKESYVTLEVDWFNETDSSQQTYYYRIPFSYIKADNADDHKNRIRSNYVYEFMVNVSQLGGLDPADAVELGANFDIMDWSTSEIDVSILDYHYLFVYDPVVAKSETSHRFEYRSSLDTNIRYPEGDPNYNFDPDEDLEVYYMVYYQNNTPYPAGIRVDVERNDPRYPTWVRTVADNGQRTFVTLTSRMPENYVPLNIELTLRNAANLTAKMTFSILPAKYVTADASTGHNSNENPNYNSDYNFPAAGAYNHPTSNTAAAVGGANNPNGIAYQGDPRAYPDVGAMNGYNAIHNNLNFYTVNTTSAIDETIRIRRKNANGTWSDEYDDLPIMVGDPTRLTTSPFTAGNTPGEWAGAEYRETDPTMQNVVSPAFIMASRRGAVVPDDWQTGWNRCKSYRESQYPAGTWRVPTFAELALFSILQNDEESAVSDLFHDVTTWWTAYEGASININPVNGSVYTDYNLNNGVNYNNTDRNVRCVRDTWREYPQDRFGVYGDYREDND